MQCTPGCCWTVLAMDWQRYPKTSQLVWAQSIRSPTPSSHPENVLTYPGAGWRHKSEEAMFKASIVEVAVRSCGQEIIVACHGGKLKTCWWTPVMREDVKNKGGVLGLVGSGNSWSFRQVPRGRKERTLSELLNLTDTSRQSLKDLGEDVTTSMAENSE